MCAGAAPLERPVGERPLHSFHLDAPPAASSGRMDTPKGGLAAAALGTAGLTALWCSQPSGQQPQVQRSQPSEPEPEPQPPRQPQSPDKEMMIMSSPRPQPQGKIPKTDSYGELGLRNTRETPGFFQHSVTGEPTARFSMQSPSSSAEPIAFDESDPALAFAAAQRRLLPKRIILVRHGESEANADQSLLRHKPDNLIELTAKGSEQALAVGQRIKDVVGDEKVCIVVR